MSSNDKIILDQTLVQLKAEVAPSLSETNYFELFSASQILKDFDLSYEEISEGIVDGANDGGIDSIYIFINKELIAEDTELSAFKKEINIELFFIQSKTSVSFKEASMDKLYVATNDLLDLSKSLDNLKGIYNEVVLKKIELFRRAHSQLAGKFPKLRFYYYYATKGSEPHPNVSRKSALIKDKVKQLFSDCVVNFEFIGSSEFLRLARRVPCAGYDLTYSENLISTSDKGCFIALVNLRRYYEFIADNEGRVRRNLKWLDYSGHTN